MTWTYVAAPDAVVSSAAETNKHAAQVRVILRLIILRTAILRTIRMYRE